MWESEICGTECLLTPQEATLPFFPSRITLIRPGSSIPGKRFYCSVSFIGSSRRDVCRSLWVGLPEKIFKGVYSSRRHFALSSSSSRLPKTWWLAHQQLSWTTKSPLKDRWYVLRMMKQSQERKLGVWHLCEAIHFSLDHQTLKFFYLREE